MLGAAIGLALSSGALAAILALIGGWVGRSFGREEEVLPELDLPAPQRREEIEAEARVQFARHLCALFIEVARADGAVVQEEIREVRRFFEHSLGFTPEELEVVRGLLKQALSKPRGEIRLAAHSSREALEAPERVLLLDALYALAVADGRVHSAEREALRVAGEALGVSEEDQRSTIARHLPQGADPYAVLGLTPLATADEVKRAFRQLASIEHPDRMAHLGPGATALASERFRRLKEAYDALRAPREE